jgi:hypothetical protein
MGCEILADARCTLAPFPKSGVHVAWGERGAHSLYASDVCLVVMGKYIRQLEFRGILLGEKPVVEPKSCFYQSLLAMDLEEADEVVNEYLNDRSLLKPVTRF